MCVCVCVRVCACLCMCVCVHECLRTPICHSPWPCGGDKAVSGVPHVGLTSQQQVAIHYAYIATHHAMHKAVLALVPSLFRFLLYCLWPIHPSGCLAYIQSLSSGYLMPLDQVGRYRKLLWRVRVDKQSQGMARQDALTCMCVWILHSRQWVGLVFEVLYYS